MNTIIRRIAVSGSAAVALLGGAAAITTATAPAASAAEIQTTINRATGTPVNMPDGRTIHVRGMDAAAYTASPAQHRVVLAAASDDQPDPSNITGGPVPGSGAPVQNPNQAPAGTDQQLQTQAGGGTVAVGVVAILVLGIVVFFRVKKHDLKAGDAVLVGLFGIALSGTVVGAMGSQLTNSLVGSLGNMLGNLG
ncbi:hypothetical protein [Streptomyces sp. NPDC056105]|uniref:hypothetical protein n=1 Tax=Streptomyces sp. NPDC056105 TaxID=3345714 RepID=UPI0035DDE081